MSIEEDILRLTPRRRLAAVPPGAADEDVPLIRLGVDLHRVVDDACEALDRDPDIYQRDGQLVRVVRVAESEADAAALAGTPQIRAVQTATLREHLTRSARWLKYDGRTKDLVPCLPTDPIVGAVAHRGQWPRLRPLVGIIETPSLRPDGSILQSAGYDAATGYVLVPGGDFSPVPDRPTKEDAARALAELAEPLRDFPYASEAHRSATLAAILTLVGRPAIVGSVPALVLDASTRGSGKSLQADVISLIASGRGASRMGYPIDDAETEKVLGAYALRGASCINFDNVSRAFGGGPLDRCLTAADSVELRVLGRSEVPSLRWRAMILASGNNVEFIGDTARRVLVSRLEPREENPELREGFAVRDLRAWTLEHRARLVVAALTILRAYVVAGRPDVGVRPWGSFEAWSSLVPSALVYAGAPDPLATRPAGEAHEPEKAALAALAAGWTRLAGTEGITAKAALAMLYPGGRPPTGPPDGYDDLRDAIEALCPTRDARPPSSRQLGYALRKARGRLLSGFRFVSSLAHGGIQRWVSVQYQPSQPQSRDGGGEDGNGGYVPTLRAEDAAENGSLGIWAKTSPPAQPSQPTEDGGDGGDEPWWERDS